MRKAEGGLEFLNMKHIFLQALLGIISSVATSKHFCSHCFEHHFRGGAGGG